MPAVIGYAAAAIANALFEGSLVAAEVAYGVLTVAVVVGGQIALSKIEQALAGKPSANGDPPQRLATTRGTTAYQQMIYGQIQTGGFVAFLGVSGVNNGVLWFVIVWAAHECEAIDDLWLESRHLLDSDISGGVVTAAAFQGNGASRLTIIKHLGGSGQTVDATLAANFPEWDSSHLGTGVCYTVFSLARDDTVWPSGAPANFFALVKGRKLYDPRLDSTNGGSGAHRYADASTWAWSQNWALAVRDYISGGAVVYAAGTPDKRKTLGDADTRIDDSYIIAAANHADESVTVPLPIIAGTTDWTHASDAIVGNGTLFTDLSAGDYLIGPDSNAYQIATITDDAHLALAIGGGYPGATVANEIVHWSPTNTTSTTESRFTADCQLSCGNTHRENLQVLLSGGNGKLTYAGGKWCLFAGVFTTPTVTLTQDDFVGAVDVSTHDTTDQAWNYVDGTFFDENNGWAQMPFPAQQNPAYETDDGRQYPQSIDLQATRGNYRAQRLAQVTLQQGRNMLTINAQALSQRALQIKEWENFFVTIPEYGWTAQIFKCVSWKFLSNGYVAIQGRAESSSGYADPPVNGYVDPSTNNPPAFVTSPPDAPLAVSAIGVINGVQLTIDPPAFFSATQFFEIWEYTSNSPFTSAALVGTTRATSFTVLHSDTVTRYYWVTVGDTNGGRSTNVPSGVGQAASPLASQFWSPQLRGNAASIGGTIFNNGGSDGWDSDATSAVPYAAVSIEGTCKAGAASSIGLATGVGSVLQPQSTAGYYGIFPHADSGQTVVFAGSSVLATLASPTVGDRYRISYDGFYVLFYVNNALEAAAPLQGAKVYAGLAMYHAGETFGDVQVSTSSIATPSEWVSIGNCVVSDTNAMKQGGSNGWDSGIASVLGYPTCHITAKANFVSSGDVFIALSTNPVASFPTATIYDLANYSLHLDSGAPAWEIWEAGSIVSTVSTAPATSDVATITYDGATVTYYLNGISVRTVSVSGLTLYGLGCFFYPASGINSLRFGPTTNLAVADSPQLAPSSSTNVVTATLASFSISSSSQGNMVTANLPAPVQDSLVIVTAIYDGYFSSGLGLVVDIFCTNVQSGPTRGGAINISHTPGAVSPGVRLSSQWEFPVAAGVSAAVNLESLSTGGGAGAVANVVMQCEVVKK